MSPVQRQKWASRLSDVDFRAINWFYAVEARDKQLPPPGDWFCWFLRSGRGFGKTRTGAEWVVERARSGFKRMALIGQTKGDVRDTMIEVGDSGIMNVAPPWFMPEYQPSKRRVVFPNGAIATVYSGDEPGQLRGPQHDTVWIDELAKFKYPQDTWDNMEFGLRVGDNPQALVTSTPRPLPIIKQLIAEDTTIDVTGSTYENISNLSDKFIKRIVKRYERTRLGKQELHGEILDDDPNALWNRQLLEETRKTEHPDLYRIVVAIDPAASSGSTGIVVVGLAKIGDERHGYVIDDATPLQGSKPAVWGKAAVTAYHKFKADLIVGEINNGGDMIENVIRNVPGGERVNYGTVRATRGKHTRAEPVSAVFENGRGHMVGYFDELEDELCTWVPGNDSPDRLDAMVWAFTSLGFTEMEPEITENPFYT